MKVWKSFGSEHSQNLVLIGKFKTTGEAEDFKEKFDDLTGFLVDQEASGNLSYDADRFNKPLMDYLSQNKIYHLSPQLLMQLIYDINVLVSGNEIHATSDDDLNALISLLLDKGAKVEVFSAHDYPEQEH